MLSQSEQQLVVDFIVHLTISIYVSFSKYVSFLEFINAYKYEHWYEN